EKLKNLKILIKDWNCKVLGNIDRNIARVEVELHLLELEEEMGVAHPVQRKAMREFHAKLW
ncbi:hypothetical protein U1Q18_036644, partial [Sarracenia purpurea var. burkii]